MKQVTDLQAVNEKMNELRWNCQKLQGIASRIYEITSVDPDYDQLMRIVQAKSNSEVIRQAEYVLCECAEQRKKRLILREDDRRDFRRFCSYDHTRWHRSKYNGPDAYEINKGKVRVNPKIQKVIEKDFIREVSDNYMTMAAWMKSFVVVLNSCPVDSVRNRLSGFAIQQGYLIEGIKVEAKDGTLEVIEATA